jgi:hypothetical protein
LIERITDRGRLLSIIIRSQFHDEGIRFFTPDDFSQQLAYMNRPKGHTVAAHIHNIVPRNVELTNEVLIIKSGKVRIDYYDTEKCYLESKILQTGDIALLAFGGHGLEMLEDSEIIEVKQGPYAGEMDKTIIETAGKELAAAI